MAEYTINSIQLPNGDVCNIQDTTYDTATTTTDGLMSAADKVKLNNSASTTDNNAKLDKNFSTYTVASTPYDNNALIPLYANGVNYFTDIGTFASSLGGSSGGTQQTSLVNYTKNCGTISSLPITINDEQITSDMVVLKATLGTPAAMTSDWTITTADGSLTISGTISGTTTLIVILGVGVTTAPTVLVNLASNSSDNLLQTNPRPGVYGILGVANGGTGANSAANARTNLDVYNKEETLKFAGPQYCDCNTTGTTQNKAIRIDNLDSSSIPEGYVINVKMKNAQLYDGVPNLAVSKKGYRSGIQVSIGVETLPIYRANGVPATKGEWEAGAILTLVRGYSATTVDDAELIAEVYYIVNGSSNYLDVYGREEMDEILTTLEEKRFKTISSGSLHDIKTSGLFYLTGAVTDKPVGNGGYYSVSVFNNNLLVGTYISTDGYVFSVTYINNTWNYQQVALTSQVNTAIAQSTANLPTIASVTCIIPNTTAQTTFDLPSGFNNAVLLGARCITKYSTLVDSSYSDGVYFGNVTLSGGGKFLYTPKVAGNSTQILFVFMKTN